MKAFAALIKELDQTTKINTKIEALAAYFNSADDLAQVFPILWQPHPLLRMFQLEPPLQQLQPQILKRKPLPIL